MINIKENKGITLVTLVTTIIILLILTGTAVYNFSLSNETSYYNKMVSDINLLNDKMLAYYNKYGEIPKTDRKITINSKEFYEIDLSKLDNLTLNYGKDYGKNDTLTNSSDVYTTDTELNIYYIKGIEKSGSLCHYIKNDEIGINKKIVTGSIKNNSKIELNKTFAERVKNYRIYGNSVQTGTPTTDNPVEIKSLGNMKNLISPYDIYAKATHYANVVEDNRNCIKFLDNTGAKYVDYHFKPNTQYTVSFDVKSGDRWSTGNTSPDMAFTFFYEDGTYGASIVVGQEAGWQHRTATSAKGKNVVGVGITSYNYMCHLFIDVDTFQIEEGTQETEYIPYGEYIIPISVNGKNLFDGEFEIGFIDGTTGKNVSTSNSKYWRTKNYIKVVPGDMVFSYQKYKLDSGCLVFCYDENKQIIGATSKIYNNISNITKDKLVDGTKYIRIYWELNEATDDIKTVFDYMQVEEGSVATVYEPYAKTITIYLDEPLRKLGESADYIDFTTGKVVRKVKIIDDTGKLPLEQSLQALATPIEENINLPDIPTYESYTEIEVLTDIIPSKIEIEYAENLST